MKNRLVSFLMSGILIVLFGIFIYPGVYKYDKLNQNLPVKINRFTGSTQVLSTAGWKSLDSTKTSNSEVISPIARQSVETQNVVENSMTDTPIVLGDLSKVKIIGSTSDNSYLYKIDCTVKNEDVLGNNVYIQATLLDKDKDPINIVRSNSEYINSKEIIVFNLATTDYNMTSKYATYKLEIIQDKNLGYTGKNKNQNNSNSKYDDERKSLGLK